jgi:hypothetical protein
VAGFAVNAGSAAAVAFIDPPLDEAPVAVAAAEAEDAGGTIETGLRAAFDAAATVAWADEDEAAEAGGRGGGGCGCA